LSDHVNFLLLSPDPGMGKEDPKKEIDQNFGISENKSCSVLTSK